MSDPIKILEAIVKALDRVAAGSTVTLVLRPEHEPEITLGGSEEAEAPGELDHPYSPRPEDPGGNCACGQSIEAHDHFCLRDKDIGSGSEDSRPEGTGGSSCKARRGGDAGQQTAASEPDASLHSTPKAEPGASDPCSTCGGSTRKRERYWNHLKGKFDSRQIPCPDCTTTEEE